MSQLEKTGKVEATTIPGLYRIALPTPFAVGDVNTYLAVDSDGLTLIDCGVKMEESYRVLSESLAELGYEIRQIKRLILTHHHTDHVGLAERIVSESGAEVWSHPMAVAWLEKPTETREKLHQFTHQLFLEGGVPQEVLESVAQVGNYLQQLSSSATIARTLDEGDTISLCDLDWRVYHTPGHAGDLICFYQPESRVMLSSDHLLKDVSSNPLIEAPVNVGEDRPRRLLDYIDQMERIAKLDISIAYAGHGNPIEDVRELVEKRIGFHAKRAEKILGLVEESPRTLYELARMLFPKVRTGETFLTFSEVLGHLDILERDGSVKTEKRGEFIYWLATT